MITLIVPEFGEYVFTKTDKGWAGPLGMDQISVDFTQCLEVIAERDATIERKDKRIAELEGQLEECDQVRFHAGTDNMTIDSGIR